MAQKENKKINLRTAIIAGLVLVGTAFLFGRFTRASVHVESFGNTAEGLIEQRENSKADAGNHFTNPLLQCDSIENLSNKLIGNLKNAVTDFLNNDKTSDSPSHVAVYFRDLNNGPWFGINEKENFTPGSLLKVPLMLTIFKVAEEDPSILDKKVLYESGKDFTKQYFRPEKEVKEGNLYSVLELMESMIEYSDNNAALLLSQLVNKDALAKSYEELGIISPTATTTEYQMPVRMYASFFRILFNASYINRSFSERALQILSQSKFDTGLRAGIPKKIVVAHKFGERLSEDEGTAQLHDCGIVYFPKHPYLLCVMARGKNFESLAKIIAGISRTIYENIEKAY